MPEKTTNIPEGRDATEAASWTGRLERGLEGSRLAIQSVFAGQPNVIKAAESLRLEEGFTGALYDLREYHLIRPCEIIPDFEQVLKTFAPEMLVAAQDFQEPAFVMGSKGRSFYDIAAAANRDKKMMLQRGILVNELFVDHAGREPKKWSAHIVEGAPGIETHEFDNIYLPLGERVKQFSAYKKASGVKGMDRWVYLALMMQKLKKGQPVDSKSSTILDGDPALTTSAQIPYAFWNGRIPWNRRVFFDWQNTDKREKGFHFRRSVGGDVPSV